MSDPKLREQTWSILADSVSEVVGNQSLVYISVKKAALNNDPSNERWASMMFNQISAANKRRIRSAAMDKAETVKDETVNLLDEFAPIDHSDIPKPKTGKREEKKPKTQVRW